MKKAKVSSTGNEARVVNPIEKYIDGPYLNQEWIAFNQANPPYPLTTPQPPNSIIEVEDDLVWEYQYRVSNMWFTCEETEFKTFEKYATYMFNSWDCATRQALKPIEATNHVADISKKVEETVEQEVLDTAEDILRTYHPISRDLKLKTDLWPDGTVIAAMKEYASQFYTADEVREILCSAVIDINDNGISTQDFNPDKYLTK